MLRKNLETKKIKKNTRIGKGCRINFYSLNNLKGNLVLVTVIHNKWSYRWQKSLDGNSSDDKMTLNINFSHFTCYPIAHIMSQVAGLTDVRLAEEKEGFLSYEVI